MFGDIQQGDEVRISTRGIEVQGVVKSIHKFFNYETKECEHAYIEVMGKSGEAHYWRSDLDGGTCIKVSPPGHIESIRTQDLADAAAVENAEAKDRIQCNYCPGTAVRLGGLTTIMQCTKCGLEQLHPDDPRDDPLVTDSSTRDDLNTWDEFIKSTPAEKFKQCAATFARSGTICSGCPGDQICGVYGLFNDLRSPPDPESKASEYESDAILISGYACPHCRGTLVANVAPSRITTRQNEAYFKISCPACHATWAIVEDLATMLKKADPVGFNTLGLHNMETMRPDVAWDITKCPQCGHAGAATLP